MMPSLLDNVQLPMIDIDALEKNANKRYAEKYKNRPPSLLQDDILSSKMNASATTKAADG